MTATSWRNRFALLFLAAGLTTPVQAARRALIVAEAGAPSSAAMAIEDALVARGFLVDNSSSVPANLDRYCCVWDVRPFLDLTPSDEAAYLAHLNDGHGVALMGENKDCCRPRNRSIEDFLRNVGGGTVGISPLDQLDFTVTEDATGSPINNTPNVVQRVTYDGQGAGIFSDVGNGEVLTTRPVFPRNASAAWREGTMTLALPGRVAVVLDINWLIEERFSTDNPEFLDNLSHFLCPTEDTGFVVDITTPLPLFVRECPALLDVAGDVLSAGPDCVQPTTLTGPAPVLTTDDRLNGWGPGGPTGDAPSVYGPLPAPPQRLALPVSELTLLLANITAIDVSLNGGPFLPVTSTAPALPASPPIAYTVAGLPLVPGPNSITIRARDDMGMEAFATVDGSMLDTLPPIIDPATCQDETIDLGPMCRIDYNVFPSAMDQCDPLVDVTSNPPLPLVITAPGTTPIDYTALDDAMNSDTCTRLVTAVDTTPPNLVCPAPQTLECLQPGGIPFPDPGVQAWLNSATASDNCAGATTITNNAPPFFDSACTPGQPTAVVFSTTDPSMNPASCASTLFVQDTTPPNLNSTPVPLTLECNTTGGVPRTDPDVQAWISTFSAADVCAAATTLSNDIPGLVPFGCAPGQATTVTFAAEDDCANVATFPQDLTIVDTTPPALTVPLPLNLECNAPGGVLRTDPQIQAWLAAATGSDICDVANLSDDAPGIFPSACTPGASTTVNFQAADSCANTTTLPSTVTVRDTTPPVLTVPADIVVECNSPGGVPRTDPQIQAFLAAATASDVCDGATVANDAPALFPSGCGPGATTTVTFTALDNCGNPTVRTARVTVRDTTPPAVVVPAPITLECNSLAGVPLSDPQIQAWLALASAADICDGATLSHDAPLLFGSGCVPGAVTVVTFTAVDNCGNTASSSSTVTVVDSTPPVPGALMRPAAPVAPRSPAAPRTACSPNSSRTFTVECSVSDICDPGAKATAQLVVTNHDVGSGGSCALRTDHIDVACGEIVEVRLEAPPCPSKPRSPRPPVTSVSGVRIFTGEAVVLHVTATDNCGNAAVATYDPAKEPSPLCDEVLEDGTCCPAIAAPPDGKCKVPLCGRCAPSVDAAPALGVSGVGVACSRDEAEALGLADAAAACVGSSDPVCAGTCARGGCASAGVALKKATRIDCYKEPMVGLCDKDTGYRCQVSGDIGCGCECR